MRWIVSALVGCGLVAGLTPGARGTLFAGPEISPVTGKSWLHTLGIDYRDTSLGRGAGRYGPSPSDPAAIHPDVPAPVVKMVTVSGGDLYRMNCQPCHRADGSGAPPEIKSVLPAVQGTTLQQMRGTFSRQDLYARIEKGGQRMPPRSHLERADIDVLYTYLTTLADGRNQRPVTTETMSTDRLGEIVAKGTCHICHDATGPRPSDQALLEGAIPPLSVVVDRSAAEFVNKVERGAPVIMGALPTPHRGRMPVFYYLNDREIAAAYQYLRNYPPR
jgi:mono/diheme cytochrome c family protein